MDYVIRIDIGKKYVCLNGNCFQIQAKNKKEALALAKKLIKLKVKKGTTIFCN